MWRYMLIIALWAGGMAVAAGEKPTFDLNQLVVKMSIADGISMDEAVDSINCGRIS